MLSTIRKVCGIDKDKFYIGKTVSPTILIGLMECLKNGTIQPGMRVIACGFGEGLSYAASIFRFFLENL